MVAPERFVAFDVGQPVALKDTKGSAFPAAGAGHGPGLVPDPGNTTHSPAYYLGDDGAFHALTFAAFNPGPLVDFQILISQGGGVIAAGNKGWLHVCGNFTINAWRVLADQSGSIVIDVLRAASGFPVASIVGGGNMPTLSSQQFVQSVLTGWTSISLVADDWIAFNVTGSPSSVTQVTVCLTCSRTS